MPNPQTDQSAADILIVDDSPTNLQLLSEMLTPRGYRARAALNGRQALRAAEIAPPDLILLDISMPEMCGFEVCEELKKNEKLRDIPVIFISALTETLDKTRAFEVGGVDYITKPFQFQEVEMRIRTHLDLRRQRRELQQSYDRLRKVEELRDNLVQMIVHDMRSPLMVIESLLQLVMETEEAISPKGKDCLQRAGIAASTLIEMAATILDVSRLEADAMRPKPSRFDLSAAALETVASMAALSCGRTLESRLPESAEVVADRELVVRVMRNLLGNALKFTPKTGWVRIAVERGPELTRLTVSDNGPGIPPRYLERIFEKFERVEPAEGGGARYSTGLGLAFCKLAVRAMGGTIGVESEEGKGSTFWVELPNEGADAASSPAAERSAPLPLRETK